MSKPLEVDDLKVGMLATVLRGEMTETFVPTPEGSRVERKEEKFFNGKILKIKAVELPYIVVEYCYKGGPGNKYPLDIRNVKLGTISKEYVNQLMPELIDETSDKENKEVDWIFDQESNNY